ncbi:hypothetical protein HDV63DRAFT_408710 [Trichoderma sp. SZMC 28014]
MPTGLGYDVKTTKTLDVGPEKREKKTPLVEITEKGIRTSDKEFKLDVIVYAADYEQDSIVRQVRQGSTAYLGVSKAGFPNLFFIVEAQKPLASVPAIAVYQGEFLEQLILKAEKMKKETGKLIVIDTIQENKDKWVKQTNAIAAATVFHKRNSCFFSDHNTPRAQGWQNQTRHEACDLGAFTTMSMLVKRRLTQTTLGSRLQLRGAVPG